MKQGTLGKVGRVTAMWLPALICVMAGGMATHIIQDGGRHLTSEVLPMVLSLVILALRRDQLARLFKRSAVAALLALLVVPEIGAQGSTPGAPALFERNAAASGGAAVAALESRVTVGELIAGSNRAPLEIHQAAPDLFVRVLRNTQTQLSKNGFDGERAWSWNDGRSRDIDGPELATFRREYHLRRPLALASFYARFGEVSPDSIGGRQVFRVIGTTPAGETEVLYFDRETGLLGGWDVIVQGTVVTTRLEDYRDVGGVRVPFRVVRSRPGFSWTEQASSIRHNAPVDPALFRKP